MDNQQFKIADRLITHCWSPAWYDLLGKSIIFYQEDGLGFEHGAHHAVHDRTCVGFIKNGDNSISKMESKEKFFLDSLDVIDYLPPHPWGTLSLEDGPDVTHVIFFSQTFPKAKWDFFNKQGLNDWFKQQDKSKFTLHRPTFLVDEKFYKGMMGHFQNIFDNKRVPHWAKGLYDVPQLALNIPLNLTARKLFHIKKHLDWFETPGSFGVCSSEGAKGAHWGLINSGQEELTKVIYDGEDLDMVTPSHTPHSKYYVKVFPC